MIPHRYHFSSMNRRAFGERVKALRQQKSWAQEELARALGVERNTVNRWEMGQRAPALNMIERIAAALGVTVEAILPDLAADRGRGPLAVPARIVTFDPKALVNAAATGPLLSLMAIVNEIRFLRRSLIVSQERLREDGTTAAERAIHGGEIGYAFRALCAVLCEASDAFAQLERKSPGVLAAATRGHADGEAALPVVRAAYAAELAAGDKGFLSAVRNWVASHYDPQQLHSELVKWTNAGRVPGELVLTPHAGLGRYSIVDELAAQLMRKALRVPERDFQARFTAKFGEVVALAEALAITVDHAVAHLVAGKVAHEHESAIRVDPLIARARRAVAAERAKARAR